MEKKRIGIMPNIGKDNHYSKIISDILKDLNFDVVDIGKLSDPKTLFPPKNINCSSIDVIFVFFPHWFYKSENIFVSFIRSIIFFFYLKKLKKKNVYYHLQNYYPHDTKSKFLDFFFINSICNNSKGIIYPTLKSKNIFHKLFPDAKNKKSYIIPHPSYSRIYKDINLTRNEAKKSLGLPINARTCLLLGQIREYKGIPDFINLFSKVIRENYYLLIFGKATNDEIKIKIKKYIDSFPNTVKKNILFREGFVNDQDIPKLYLSADFAVTNYVVEPANPGAPVLAMNFGVPIYGSNQGSLVEIFGDKNMYGYNPSNYENKLETLKKAFEDKNLNDKRFRILERNVANHSEEKLKMLYKDIIG